MLSASTPLSPPSFPGWNAATVSRALTIRPTLQWVQGRRKADGRRCRSPAPRGPRESEGPARGLRRASVLGRRVGT